MFLGLFTLGTTLAVPLQLAAGNSPVTATGTPTFRIYSGASSTPVATGSLSASVVDSQTGLHLLTQALTIANGFAVGVYVVRVAYVASATDAVQEYAFQVT